MVLLFPVCIMGFMGGGLSFEWHTILQNTILGCALRRNWDCSGMANGTSRYRQLTIQERTSRIAKIL
jgi:hypothetical protein